MSSYQQYQDLFVPVSAAAIFLACVFFSQIISEDSILNGFLGNSKPTIKAPEVKLGKDALKIAFCVTGQLPRLELLSKIANVFVPNARAGHLVHVFIQLDDSQEVKQTFWRYDYTDTPYADYTAEKIEILIARKTYPYNLGAHFKARVRIGPPSQDLFEVVDGFVPVIQKEINTDAQKYSTKDGKGVNDKMVETAEDRFKNNLAWMAGLRDCVKWTQEQEQEQGYFYDVVVRLREDSLVFDTWNIVKSLVKGTLTSGYIGANRGINDHNMVLDRRWTDVLFRGIIEDYYFKGSNRYQMWNNSESRIAQVAEENKVTVRATSFCEMPMIPLRSTYNKTHWLVHPQYAKLFATTCRYCCRCRSC